MVTITAIPSEGYSFVEWTDPYGSTWGSSNLNVTMFENRSFQAVFELIPIVDFNFNYYIDNNSLPESWVTEFYTNQDYIIELLPINSYVDQFSGNKYVDGVDIYAWSSAAQRPSDFPDISGGCLCGFNDYESSSHIRMSLEVNNNEIENDDIHRHLLPIHEYFHAYQSYLRGFTFHGDYIWLTEGPAAIMEALFSQQQYGVDYWYTTREENIYSRISSENAYLFEKYSTSSGLEDEFGERYVINYASQVFLVLILSKEIQKTGYSEEQALRKIFVEFLENSPTNDNWKEIFQQVFGFSLEDFYLKINSYNINRENIIPSSNIKLEDIFY